MAIEQNLELRLPLRETAQDLRPGHLFSKLAPEADFFQDQIDSRLRVIPELWVKRKKLFG